MELQQWQSAEIGELVKAIAAAQMAMKPAVKDASNPFFKSKYADLSAVWAVLHPFSEQGIAITQSPMPSEHGTIVLDTQLSHSSGQWMRSRLVLPVAKHDPQGYGSAITYARRYALGAMTGIVTEEDDDGNAASTPQPKAQAYTQQKQTVQAKIAELRQDMQEPARQDSQGMNADVSGNGGTQQGPDAAAPFISNWKVPNATWMKPDCGKRADELDDSTLTKYVNYYEGKLAKEPNSRYRGEWDEALRALVAVAMHREQSNPSLL